MVELACIGRELKPGRASGWLKSVMRSLPLTFNLNSVSDVRRGVWGAGPGSLKESSHALKIFLK